LSLTHGNSVGAPGENGQGGALFIDGGVLNATGCQFTANRASGGTASSGMDAGGGYGGAIFNRSGGLNLTNCTFLSNQALGGVVHPMLGSGRGGAGMGGVIYNERGTLHSIGTHFFSNTAQGGVPDSSGGLDGAAFGGAVYSTNGTIDLENCVLSTNTTVVGPSPRNTVPGPAGGGAVYIEGGTASLVTTVLSYNQSQGDHGMGGATEGNGGAIFNLGQLDVTNCTFLSNVVTGGAGRGTSRAGTGGAIHNLSNVTAVNTTFDKNSATGGHGFGDFQAGSAGANGDGGGIYSTGAVVMLNCTLFQNTAFGGDGANFAGLPQTDGGAGRGGAIYASGGSVGATNLSFFINAAEGGRGGVSRSDGVSQGGAIYVSTGAVATILNTILANSFPGSNCFGTLTDGGHNISSDASCNFTSAGSLNSTDPELGPFGDYGGPTATITLLAGSPAIDAGDAGACPATDQRGISRPYGAGCDIGAFESAPPYTVNGHVRGYLSPAGVVVNVGSNSVPVDASGFYTFTGLTPGSYTATPIAPETRFVPISRVFQVGPDNPDTDFKAYHLNAMTVESFTNADFQIVYAGDINGTYRTLTSTNLIDWSLYSTNRTDTNGLFVITNLYFGADGYRFLRVVKP